MGADRPGDADMPPDDHPDRRGDQDDTGDHAARGGNGQAETRTRQEYYSDLRVTVSREESTVARQTTAEEQAAADKWQETAAESRWIWSEYQRKWPPTERPAVDRSKDPAGSWRVDGNRSLGIADNSRVEAECDRIARREEEKISPALRCHRKPRSRPVPGRLRAPPERPRPHQREGLRTVSRTSEPLTREAVSLVPDAIRYTFQYRESRYTQGVWTDIECLKGEGFKLDKLKNYWSDDQYKGINSTWIEPDTGQRLEVQFHTRISFEAKQLTHTAYERIRSKQADEFEELVLEAFQRKVTGDVPVPLGAADISDYRKGA